MENGKRINTFRAFQNRNYTLYFTGQSVSLIGTWMQRTGISWVVYTMTHSTVMLGLTVFASQFPSFLFSLWGGILSDRYNRYKLLLLTQTASMIQAILLAILTLTNHFVVWQILTLSVILGIINAFDLPARQPLVHELVTNKDDIPNALALNSSMVNIARLVGPALSGIVLGYFGAGICFLINAVSFVAVIVSLLLMKLPAYKPVISTNKITSDISEGFSYLKNTPSISLRLLLLAVLSLLILPYDTLLPVFAKIVFKGDAATFGYISSFIGLGAIGGTIFLASLRQGASLKSLLLINIAIVGVGLILFSRINNFPIAMLFATLSGFGAMSQNTISITIIQVKTDAAMRGRVMSYVAMAYFGMLPLGSLLIGSISQKIGAQDTLLLQGIISLLIAGTVAAFLRKERLKKEDMGQLEEAEETSVEGL
jgi:MFS family permease